MQVVLQVLSIGETVVEVNDSGFLGTVPTLRTQLLSDDSMLQVSNDHSTLLTLHPPPKIRHSPTLPVKVFRADMGLTLVIAAWL